MLDIFKNIRRYFRGKKRIRELFDDVKDLDEVLLEKRLEIFKEKVTPAFAEIGLVHWNGKYCWFSDTNEDGIKQVIQYHIFKGYESSFSYGICFDFVPTISGKRMIYHRTDKSTKIIYEKLLEGWQNHKEDKAPKPYRVKLYNEKKFRISLDEVLQYNLPTIKKWFTENQNLEQVTESLLHDVENPPFTYEFERNLNSYAYMLAFIYKHKKQFEASEFWMNKHFQKKFNTPAEVQMIYKKLKT